MGKLTVSALAILVAGAWTVLPVGAQDTVKDKAERTGEKIENKAERAGEKIENKAERAGDKIENKADRAEDKTDSAMDKLKAKTREAKEKVKAKTENAKDKLEAKTEDLDARGSSEDVRAMQQALKALGLNPGYADAHYNLARLYELTGERQRALRHLACYRRLIHPEPSQPR